MTLRSWATPLTIGAFLLMTVTGVLMFFHVRIGLVTAAHEWLSWAFLLGAAAHVVVNWRPFVNYLRKPVALVIIGCFVLLTVAAMLPLTEAGPPVIKQAVGSLMRASVRELAPLVDTGPEVLVERLKAAGLNVSGADDGIDAIARASGTRPDAVLAVIYAGGG